jgi:hypothetical protein
LPTPETFREEQIMAEQKTQSTSVNSNQSFSSDLEMVLEKHLGKLRDELGDELGKVTTAGAQFGGAAGMAMLGTVLGGLAFVHLVHRITGLPLWLCYAGSSAAACGTAAALIAAGTQKASEVSLVPQTTSRDGREAMGLRH